MIINNYCARVKVGNIMTCRCLGVDISRDRILAGYTIIVIIISYDMHVLPEMADPYVSLLHNQ